MDDKGGADMLTLQTLTGKLILTSPCQNRLGLNLTDFKFMAKESEFADHLLRQSGERAARAECDSLTACPLPTLANAPRGPPQPPPQTREAGDATACAQVSELGDRAVP